MKKILQSLVDACEGNVWNLDFHKPIQKIIPATSLPSYFTPQPNMYSPKLSKIALHFGDWRLVKANAVLMGSRRNFMSTFLSQINKLNLDNESNSKGINQYDGLLNCNSDRVLYTNTEICQSYQIDKQIELAIQACVNNRWESLIIPEQIIGYQPTPLYNSVYQCIDIIVKSLYDSIENLFKTESNDYVDDTLKRVVFCTTSNSTWRLYNTLIPWHFTLQSTSNSASASIIN